jgi:sec-independent protein translocase protein TatB
MFDLGWGELLVIGMVALIAIGPKELPTVLRSLGQWMGKIKRMAGDFQGQFQEALREAEMADLKKHADELTSAVTDATKFDRLADIDNDGDSFDSAEPAKSGETSGESDETSVETAAIDDDFESDTHAENGESETSETVSAPEKTEAHAAEPAAAEPAPEPAEATQTIDVPPPEVPEPVTEKDFAPAEPRPKQAGGTA